MLRLIFIAALFFTSHGFVQAQDMMLPDDVLEPEQLTDQDRDRLEIDESELPAPVVRALDEGSYEGVVIADAFVLQGDALIDAAAERTDIVPQILYELQIWQGDRLATIYFTEYGEIYEADRSV